MNDLIPIAEYAKLSKNKKSVISVRQKCQRGGFRTATKLGRDWFINKNEVYPDFRKGAEKMKFLSKEEVFERATKNFILEVANERYNSKDEYDCCLDSTYYEFSAKEEMYEFSKQFKTKIENGYGTSLFFYILEDFKKDSMTSEHFDCTTAK